MISRKEEIQGEVDPERRRDEEVKLKREMAPCPRPRSMPFVRDNIIAFGWIRGDRRPGGKLPRLDAAPLIAGCLPWRSPRMQRKQSDVGMVPAVSLRFDADQPPFSVQG